MSERSTSELRPALVGKRNIYLFIYYFILFIYLLFYFSYLFIYFVD